MPRKNKKKVIFTEIIQQIKKDIKGFRQSKSANIDDIENNKDMDAGFDSSNSQNKSLSIKFEGIEQNT